MLRITSLGILTVLALGCGDGAGEQAVALRFAATVDDTPFSCGTSYDGLGASSSTLTVNDFRLYVSELVLVTAAGAEVPLVVEEDGKWQAGGAVLLDFEGGCSENGTPDQNDRVLGTVPADDYVGVRFTVGVPFDMNHANQATAPSPLNLTSMWWSWQAGYKFFRLDGATPELPAWRFHLGSTGCDGGPTGGVTTCAADNRVTVSLADFDVDADVVRIDLAALLAGVDLATQTPETPPGCMASQTDPDCAPYFENLGLSFGGAAADTQRVFGK